MSDEGFTLIFRALLALSLLACAALFRTLLGHIRGGRTILLAGTLAGITSGVVVSEALSPWIETDISALAVCLGMVCYWWAGYLIAKKASTRVD